MNSLPFLLPVFTAATLSSVYFLPTSGEVAQSAIIMKLPTQQKEWRFQANLPSKQELQALAKDTEFSKAICIRPLVGRYNRTGHDVPDRIDLSIVLSGSDINNSIHRPERCMPAQGHQILSSSDRLMELKNGNSFRFKRLISVQRLPTNPERSKFLELKCLTYYFFVGHNSILNSHIKRTFFDMKDRLLRGQDQRWAYVSVSMWFGEIPWIENNITEQEADKILSQFTKDFSQDQIDWSKIKH